MCQEPVASGIGPGPSELDGETGSGIMVPVPAQPAATKQAATLVNNEKASSASQSTFSLLCVNNPLSKSPKSGVHPFHSNPTKTQKLKTRLETSENPNPGSRAHCHQQHHDVSRPLLDSHRAMAPGAIPRSRAHQMTPPTSHPTPFQNFHSHNQPSKAKTTGQAARAPQPDHRQLPNPRLVSRLIILLQGFHDEKI